MLLDVPGIRCTLAGSAYEIGAVYGWLELDQRFDSPLPPRSEMDLP
jgi:hypothetical protein